MTSGSKIYDLYTSDETKLLADSRSSLLTVVDPVNGNTSAEMTLSACDGRLFDLSHPLLYNDKRGELYMISAILSARPACK